MKLDEPFRITSDLLIAWAVLSIPSLWFARPWEWEVPLYSRFAAILFIPFAVTIATYCPILFVRSVLASGPFGARIAKAFFSVIAATALMLTLAYTFGGFQPVDSWLIILVAAWANKTMGAKIDHISSGENGGK